MKTAILIPRPFTLIALAGISFLPLHLAAYESYHDPALNDQGYCSTCHPGFGGGRSDTLHALHTGGSDPVTGTCNLCHDGPGSDNPFTLWSKGDADDGLGCMGCHGRDYGETVGANHRGEPIAGMPKNSGYGLRLHHHVSGITVCAGCHGDPTSGGAVQPHPENVIDPGLGNTVHYYLCGRMSASVDYLWIRAIMRTPPTTRIQPAWTMTVTTFTT
jgi:predicted CXXCH cytochrome family protein